MKKVFLNCMLLLCALIVGSGAWADPITIASFDATDYNGGTTGGWSVSNSDYATSKKGNYYKLVSSEGIITTPSIDWSSYTGVKITITARKFGGPDATQGKISVKQNSTELTNFSPNSTDPVASSALSISPTGTGSLNITCPGASSGKGCGVFSVEITGTAATPAYTITAVSNNVSYGTVSLSGSVITASPITGHRYASPAYTVTMGTATVSQTGNNFTVTPSSDCTVRINFEEIPTHTLSYTVSPVGAGSVTLGTSSVKEGSTTTATAAANDGYVFTGWSITGTGASLSSTTTNPTIVTMGTDDATVTATFATLYTVQWSVNGVIVKAENVKEGDDITFAAPTSGIPGGYYYKGWSESAIVTPQATETGITYVNEATASKNVVYYCVIATISGTTPATLTKMVKGNTFTAGDKVVIVAQSGEDYYGLYQETTNSSYVKNYDFDGQVSTVASDDKNWWTVSAGSNSKWILGDATNGYLYSSGSNNLSVDEENYSEWTLSDNDNGTFGLNQGRYLSCRSDLTGTNQYLYRLAGGSPAGIYNLEIYKYVAESHTYTNYCTTVPAYTLYPTPDGYTTFFHATEKIKVPAGVTVYRAEYDEGESELALKAFTGSNADVIPANCPVILKVAPVAAFEVEKTDESAFAIGVLQNDLIGSTGTTANEDTYVLAYQGTPAATGFFKMTSGTIPAHKAYLDLSGSPAPSAIRIVEENNNATSIENLNAEDKAVKFIENGVVYILRDGITYDVMGRIVK